MIRLVSVAVGVVGVGVLLRDDTGGGILPTAASAAVTAVGVVLPLARVAAVLPTPGGTGGVESVLVWLLTITTGVGATAAAGGVLFYRLVAFWLPLGVGGLLIVGLLTRGVE